MPGQPYRIMFDLEATCWEDKDKQEELSEIIEIGAVKFNPKSFDVVDTFERLVTPVRGEISEYCTELTGIKPFTEDHWQSFTLSYQEFMQWAGDNPYFLAWGQYDYDQIAKDCEYHGIKPFAARRYMNAKHLYQYFTGQRAGGLGKRIKSGEVTNPLPQHRALNDVLMTVQVLKSAWLNF